MTVYGCMVAYQEEDFIAGALESLARVVDEIIVVEGAFAGFEGYAGSHRSTDATAEIAMAAGAKVIRAQRKPWPSEREARTKYLVGTDGDWYIVLDADERIVGSLPALDPDVMAYKVQIKHWPAHTSLGVRIFQHQGVMTYQGSHFSVYSDDRLITRHEDATLIEACWILHQYRGEEKRAKWRRAFEAARRQRLDEHRQAIAGAE